MVIGWKVRKIKQNHQPNSFTTRDNFWPGMLQKADEDLEDIGIFQNFANFTGLYLRAPDEFDNNFWFFEKISISTFDL